MSPVGPLQYMCVLSYTLTHHLIIDKVSTEKETFMYLATFKYLRKRLRLTQLSSPGELDLVAKKETAV